MIVERIILYSTKPLNGVYKFREEFQIFSSRRKPIQEGRFYFPITLEFSYSPSSKTYFRYGYPHGADDLTKKIIEYQHLLSVATQFFFFDFIKEKNFRTKLTKSRAKKVGTGKIRWYQDKALDDRNVPEMIVPPYIDKFLEAYYSIDEKKRPALRKSMYLFYTGIELRGRYPSISFASLVSSIETLINLQKYPSRPCNMCGQKIFKVGERFRDFLKIYAFNGKMNREQKRIINKIYGIRSKILHEGNLLLASKVWERGSKDMNKRWDQSFIHKDLIEITRACIINWTAS